MPTKIDLLKLESYSIAFSEKLCTDFYQGNTSVILGNEILKFTEIDQLNLFIVKNLFERWKEESTKLRSPYFDYENEEVKDALSSFLNKLSKHISIRKEFFKPLVKKSVEDSLAYLIDPYQFLKAEFLGKPIITLAELMEKEKYVRVNKFFIQSLIKKMQLQNKTGFPEPEVLSYFEEVYKNYESSLEPPSKHIEVFARILPITIDDLLQKGPERPRDPVINYREILNANVKKDEIPFKGPLADTIHERNNVATINDSFARSKQLSLNDVMRKGEETSILSKHRKSKIHDLKTAVPINLRYIFINELFKGNADDYSLALVQIERCVEFPDAKNILDQVYSKKYNWSSETTEVKEFLELVERRFY